MCKYSGKQFEICSQGEMEGEGRQPDGRLVESLDFVADKKCLDKRVFSLLVCEPLLRNGVNFRIEFGFWLYFAGS